jgi:Carboxypeptidase regulatory-like domain/TonB-dependent Receptor Plug Domain
MIASFGFTRTALLVACALAASLRAQGTSGAELSGFVLADSTDTPLANAEVAIPELQLATRTNATGEFRIRGISAGQHKVMVRLLGYAPIEATFAFRDGDRLERDFVLVPKPVELSPVKVAEKEKPVRGKMSAFEERRAGGLGSFITRDELEKQDSRRMSEILGRMPGLGLRRGLSSVAWVTGRRGSSAARTGDAFNRRQGAKPDCYSDVYIDGSMVYGAGMAGEPLFDINSLSPSSIEAVEFYSGPAQVPAQYNKTGSVCGVLLIWTRVGGS